MNSTPYTVKFKRASDLFPPPIADPNSVLVNWDLKSKDLNELIDWLDQEKFTGVLKASSHETKFRGALLLFAGWCVGAVYAVMGEEPIKHTYKALPAILAHLQKNNSSDIEIYSLPEEIVLPFSSAFIGHFMEPIQNESPSHMAAYFVEHIINLPRHSLISIRTLTPTKSELCLVFFYWGKITGHFMVEEQKFSSTCEFPEFIFDQILEAKIHLSILSPEIDGVYSGSTRFGFPLILEPKTR